MNNIKFILAVSFILNVAPAVAEEVRSDGLRMQYQGPVISQAAENKKAKAKNKALLKSASAESRALLAGSCQVRFESFADQRQNRETVGATFSHSLMPSGIDVWLKDAEEDLWLNRLKTPGSGPILTVRPALTRLYAYSQSSNLYGVMAINVDFVFAEKIVETRKYRGFGSTFNTVNADEEYLDTLNNAAHKSMSKVLEDIPIICSKLKS